MVLRTLFVIIAIAASAVVTSLVPEVSQTIRAALASLTLSVHSAAASLPLPEPVRNAIAALPPPTLAAQDRAAAPPKHAEGKEGHADDEHKDGTSPAGRAPAKGGDGHGHAEGAEEEAAEGTLKLSPEQITTARIETAKAAEGTLARRLTVPGTIAPAADRVGRVAAKVVGTVAELNKQLGDPVAKGEVVAVLDSREVAEAKSEYLAASVNFELQRTLFEREQGLFQKNIIAEQQFLRTRTAFSEVQLRVDLARQKLLALGVPEKDVATLSRQTQALQRYELRSPVAGRVVERLVDLGAPVGGEGQAKELFGIADLSQVWVELAVSPRDLPSIKEGQTVQVTAGGLNETATGKIVFKSPILNQETRSARVVAQIASKDGAWQPGTFVTANITVEEQKAPLVVPKSALQTIGKEQVVFVRTPEGFEKREVALGRTDGQATEIVFGLDPGEEIAVANTFTLKAELGKSEASHAH